MSGLDGELINSCVAENIMQFLSGVLDINANNTAFQSPA